MSNPVQVLLIPYTLLKSGADYRLISATISEQFSHCLSRGRNFSEKIDIILFHLI